MTSEHTNESDACPHGCEFYSERNKCSGCRGGVRGGMFTRLRRVWRIRSADGVGTGAGEGEWHGHWFGVKHDPAADCCFTLALRGREVRTPPEGSAS